MNSLKSYLSRQSTNVLTEALACSGLNIYQTKLLEEILQQRQGLLDKYSHDKLMSMTPTALIELLNSPELRVNDLVASRTIMSDILNILDLKESDDLYFSKELIAYLIKWETY